MKGAAEALSRVKMLAALSRPELETLASACRRAEFPAGSVIMHEGEIGDSMYLFVEGEVDVTRTLTMKTGRRGFASAEKSFVKLRAESAAVFGEMAMIGSEPRSATITAAAACVLYEVDRAAFEELCARDPALGLKLLRAIASLLAGRVRSGNNAVLKLSTALSIALSK